LGDVQEAYSRKARAEELNYEHQKFLQTQEWQDIVHKFAETKERLLAAETLESVQKEKLEHERQRQTKGRTTLFQVLTFETEYSNAQLARLKALTDLLQLAAKMRLYGVNHESR